MSFRIWLQSSLDINRLPGYGAFMRRHASEVCASDVTVDVHGVCAGSLTDDEYFKYSGYGEHFKIAQIVESAVRAEREGYQAVAISCFLDTGLQEARAAVSIPVVSSMETMLEVAAKGGRAVALVTRAGHMTAPVRNLVRQYNRQHLIAAQSVLDGPMSLQALDAAYDGSKQFVGRFKEQASSLIRAGADVILPAEGVLNTVLVSNGVVEVEGVPVLDSCGTLLAYAEMLARIRGRNGRKRNTEPIPADVAERLRSATAALLRRA